MADDRAALCPHGEYFGVAKQVTDCKARKVLSLDVPVAGGTELLGCILAETDGLAAWHGQNRCSVNDADLRHDLGRALREAPQA